MPNLDARPGTLDGLLARARAILLFERLWPVAVAVLTLGATFFAVSWFGLWVTIPKLLRALGVLAFAAALVVVALRAWRARLPGRREALARLDRDSGVPHRPISSAGDALADPLADPVTHALWTLHRRRLDEALGRVRLRAPSPRMVDRDRYALRAGALLLLVAAGFVAGPERGGRVAAAFDWFGEAAPGPGFRLDSWIDPPAYTGRPPVVLSGAGGPAAERPEGGLARAIAAPVGSTVVVRASGEGRVVAEPSGGVMAASAERGDAGSEPTDPSPGRAASPPPSAGVSGRAPSAMEPPGAETELRFRLAGDGRLTVKRDGTPAAIYDLTAIPDRPPTIALAGTPVRNARGSLTLRYAIDDDYGAVGAEALLSDPIVGGRPAAGRHLVEPPRLPLSLPAAPRGLGTGETTADLADSPWAGATVTMVLTARDEGGNIGRSVPGSVVLPARRFTQPLARALVEQRRDLVLDPDHHDGVGTALDGLTLAPDLFDMSPAVFLGLRTAKARLDAATADADLVGVSDLLWAMALQIEDGDLSKTERDLKALQQELKDALARQAPAEEIKRLTEALRRQLDQYLAEMARKAEPSEHADRRGPTDKGRTITPRQLQAMIDRMEQAARNGDVAEAQRMLDQLRGVLDNLKTAKRQSGAQQQAQRQMNQAMNDLDRMMRDQQALRDETFKEGRDGRKAEDDPEAEGENGTMGQDGPQDGGPSGQPAPGQGGGEQKGAGGQGRSQGRSQGKAGAGGDLQGRQNGLRQMLGQLQRRMRDMGLEGEKGFDAAGRAMQDAEGALGEGQGGNDRAVEAQGRALRALQQGAQGLAKQMAQGQGQGQQDAQDGEGQDGEGQDDGTGGPNGQQTDPLGRPRGRRTDQMAGPYDDLNRDRIGNGDLAARARQVLEELRRRLGDPSRPQVEQDYLERLLKRY